MFFPETSLDTSLAIDKDSFYSIYLFKVFGLSIADIIILVLFFVIILKKPVGKFNLGIIKPIAIIFLIYIIIGCYYNVFVAFEPKGLLYDIKVSLYLFIPFIVLKKFFSNIEIKESHIYLLAFLFILGAVYDAIYVSLSPLAAAEYSSRLGLPVLYEILPIAILFGIGTLMSNGYKKNIFMLFFLWEILSSINRTNLGNLYNVAIVPIALLLVKTKINKKRFLTY